ncbi:MAG: hypothetical protein QMD06_03615 [Candidatus Altarchaeum sp.]|nr:hypothetical protein [Candidatus Altarchaeum sp.]
MEKENKKEPIYEKLALGEILIISKDKHNCLEAIENKDKKIIMRTVCLLKKKQ